MNPTLMAIVNLTPDSFWQPSRTASEDFLARVRQFLSQGAGIIDIGAVSTRPGAAPVSLEQEWDRLEQPLHLLAANPKLLCSTNSRYPRISLDTTRSEIVRRAYDIIGQFLINDISAAEDDPLMLSTAASLQLPFVAMHKRGNPQTMDAMSSYEDGIIPELIRYFRQFEQRAYAAGLKDWILDPGLGFAKTNEQNWHILENLEALKIFHRPILIGAADKRFTAGDTPRAHRIAIAHGADILRIHDIL